ncbi:ABC transporter ATP-binding protein [Proteinivorax hydrogeniformans]|uniref:ABC transporter ATP-binding protein n=1 Tax=Proteinivorax hydrogeniformans TaxID=1826727 RepID=A0AAU8HVT0_9FIRM
MILSVKDVRKSYGKEEVLKGISFEITEPQIIALVGPNGSGKTTLLNVITNLLTSNGGEVSVLGKSNKNPDIFKEISYMQDNSVLYDYLTGYDHLQFIGDIQGITKEKILETVKWIGIDSYMHKKVGNYSLGMKQHLLLTMAIVNKPKLLILDEPLNGLDPSNAIKIRKIMLQLYKANTTILLSSHNLAEIDRLTSQIMFLKNGNLIKEDISVYEKTCYDLSLGNVDQAKEILAKKEIPVEIVDEKVRVFKEASSLYPVFLALEENNIILDDIQKKIWGSEERYKMIFGEDS